MATDLGSQIARPVEGMLLGLLNAGVSGYIGAITRNSTYDGNRFWPNLLPDVATAIRLYHAGIIAQDDLSRTLTGHGIRWYNETLDDTRNNRLWQAIVGQYKGRFDDNFYRLLYRRGVISSDLLGNIMRRHGFDPSDNFAGTPNNSSSELDLWATLSEPLPWSVVLDQFARGLITLEQAQQLLVEAGITDVGTQGRILGTFRPIDLVAGISLLNRGYWDEATFRNNLLRHQYWQSADQDAILRLRDELPTPSDLVRFAVRHIFEPSLAAQFGFDSEISPDFIDWHSKLGFGYPIQITDPIDGQVYTTNWAKAQWQAHWVWPSPGMGYQFVQRLRATGGPNGGPRDPSGIVFTQQQLQLLLRGNDYPPIFRPMLQAISYRVIGIRQIRQLVANKIWGQSELYEGFQDLGYSPSSSDILARNEIANVANARLKRLILGQKSRLLKAYELGLVSRINASIALYQLEIQSQTELDQWNATLPADQVTTATEDQLIQATLDGVDSDLSVKLSQVSLAAIRRSFLTLESDVQTTRQALAGLGVQPPRIDQYISLWQWQFYGRGKSLAVGQITKAIVRGVLSPTDAVARLQRLGYPLADSYALVQLALQDQASYLLRAQQTAANSAAKQRALLIQQQKALKQQLAQAQHDLARQAPVSKMGKWLSKGYISQAEVEQRLTALNYDATFIKRYIADATSKLVYSKKQAAIEVHETPIPPTDVTAGSG